MIEFLRTGGGVTVAKRYIWATPSGGLGTQPLTMTVVGRVYLTPIDVPWNMTVDRIIVNFENPVAGNVRVAIYEEGAADTPVGGALLVESGSTVIAGANGWQAITIANTALNAGQHYVAIQSDATTCQVVAFQDNLQFFQKYYDLGAYGLFTDPCPAIVVYSRPANMGLRVASIP